MGSLFINAGIAAGVGLAAIPVILHLFMKQTPKRVVFPALRLIRKRQERTKKRLRIKNWLLLAARMLLLALMALALARPRFNARIQAGDERVESAIAMVFDTSLSMGYTEQDKSRLDEAKGMAERILQRTHAGSQVFVIDSARAVEPVALSPAAARKAIESLEVEPSNQTLNQALGLAYGAVAASNKPRREVFVLTDLTRSAWGLNQSVANLDKIEKLPGGVGTYVMSLGPPGRQRHDVGIVRVEPAAGVVSQDEPVPVRAVVRATGPTAARRVVEFYVDGQKKDQKTIDVPAGSEAETAPFLPRFKEGMHRVEVRLYGDADPLPANDAYYLTYDVRPAVQVLILSDVYDPDAAYVANALDPEANRSRPDAPRPYHVEHMPTSRLDVDSLRRSISGYAAVFLLNVRAPSAELWRALGDYVKQGGGLVIGVGDRVAADPDAYNGPDDARALMPATLGPVRIHEDFSFGRADVGNALFAQYTRELVSELGRVPIYKTMAAEPIGDARTLLSYQDETPALLERVVGDANASSSGRVLLWTTALARVPQANATWNEFPIANWSFMQLVLQTVPYLSGATGRRLTIEAGESVTLPIDPSLRLTDFAAQPPGQSAPINLNPPTAGRPLVVSTRATGLKANALIGPWTVVASRPGGPSIRLGFSVNPPRAESDLTPLEPNDLDRLLGKDGYKIAESFEDLKVKVNETTIGREIFPWLMLAILLIVTAENALANLFYRDRPTVGGGVAEPRPKLAAARA
jgi:hypothetical protein